MRMEGETRGGWKDKETERRSCGQTGGRTVRDTDERISRWTDGRMDNEEIYPDGQLS
jgi:hypothetical protein